MLWTNVRGLNRRGMTIILTTHYLEEAQEMCDEIAIIDRGRVVARDTTSALVGRMDTKTLVVTPDGPVPGDLALPEGVSLSRRPSGVQALGYSRSRVAPGAVLAALAAAGVGIRDLATEEPDLEDVFLSLTGSAVA